MANADKDFDLVFVRTSGNAELVPKRDHSDAQAPRIPLFTVRKTDTYFDILRKPLGPFEDCVWLKRKSIVAKVDDVWTLDFFPIAFRSNPSNAFCVCVLLGARGITACVTRCKRTVGRLFITSWKATHSQERQMPEVISVAKVEHLKYFQVAQHFSQNRYCCSHAFRFVGREPCVESLYSLDVTPVQTTVTVDRNPTTGQLLGYKEVRVTVSKTLFLLWSWGPVWVQTFSSKLICAQMIEHLVWMIKAATVNLKSENSKKSCVTRRNLLTVSVIQEFIPDTGTTIQNSTSLRRPPGPPDQNVKGKSTNYPFWPGKSQTRKNRTLIVSELEQNHTKSKRTPHATFSM